VVGYRGLAGQRPHDVGDLFVEGNDVVGHRLGVQPRGRADPAAVDELQHADHFAGVIGHRKDEQ
jgi:hypothetical protein